MRKRCKHCKAQVWPTPLFEGKVVVRAWPSTCPWCKKDGLFLEPLDGVDRMAQENRIREISPTTFEQRLTLQDRRWLAAQRIGLEGSR